MYLCVTKVKNYVAVHEEGKKKKDLNACLQNWVLCDAG